MIEPSLKVRRLEHPFDALDSETVRYFSETSRDSYVITFQTFFFKGVAYPLEELGEGIFHKVFSFREVKELTIQGQKLQTSNIIIKIYKPEGNKKKFAKIITDDLKAYDLYSKRGILLPYCYANPETYPREKDPIWILERLPTPITGDSWANGQTYEMLSATDQRVIDFAKKHLTENARGIANKIGEFIGDFNPKNVMLNSAGNPVVVDPTLPENDKWNCKENLKKNVEHWSRGNTHITTYLTQDFPLF